MTEPGCPVVVIVKHPHNEDPTVVTYGNVEVIGLSSFPMCGQACEARMAGDYDDYAGNLRHLAATMAAKGADKAAEVMTSLANQFDEVRATDPDWQELHVIGDRERLVAKVLGESIAPYRLRIVTREIPTWLATHAGGFTSLGQTGDDGAVDVLPGQIVALGSHLRDNDFALFVETIKVWQHATLSDFVLRREPATIVAKFGTDHPEAAEVLFDMAAHHHLDALAFLGAQEGNQQ